MVLRGYNETKNFFFTTAFHCTKLKTWRMNCMCHIVRTGENTCIIISLTITAIKKLNFLTRPDLAFSFFNKRSGNEIKRLVYNKLKVSYYCHQQVTFISYLIPCVKDKFFSYWWRWENKPTFFWVAERWGAYRQNKSVKKYLKFYQLSW